MVEIEVPANRVARIQRIVAKLDWLEQNDPKHLAEAMKFLARMVASGPEGEVRRKFLAREVAKDRKKVRTA